MSDVDLAVRQIVAARRLAQHREQITAWRLVCETCDTIGKRLGVDGSTVALACQGWGVKPPRPIHKGREPLVKGSRCAKCEALLDAEGECPACEIVARYVADSYDDRSFWGPLLPPVQRAVREGPPLCEILLGG